jgi:hypothetical protein
MKKSCLLVAMAALLLSGCTANSGSQESQTTKSSSQQAAQVKKASSKKNVKRDRQKKTAATSQSSSSLPATSASSSAATNSSQNTAASRIAFLNQQLIKQLGQVVLPQADGLSSGSQQLNIRYQGNAANFTVYYSIGTTAKAFNVAALSAESPYAQFSKQTYSSVTAAQQQIGYRAAADFSGLPTVDLGSGNLTGTIDSGAGQRYLSWYEGRWFLTVHAAAVNQENPLPLAKQTAAFLEIYLLPTPRTYGRITFQAANTNDLNQEIIWQENNVVYQLKTQTPQTALKMAVSVK